MAKVKYTTTEGGDWIPLHTPYSDAEIESYLRATISSTEYGDLPAALLSKNNEEDIIVFAVTFEDGSVWDAHIGGFRQKA